MNRRILRSVALALFLMSALFWLARGANRGWTKTSVQSKTLDPTTGIEGINYQERFVPGVDFLAGSAALTFALFGISLFINNKGNSANR
jgi:hypothetical protein